MTVVVLRQGVPTPDDEVFVLGTPTTPLPLDPGQPMTCNWRPGDPW
jgi:hypothetical protein